MTSQEITGTKEARNLVSQWAEEASFYLSAVVGPHHRKKRVTLLRLAEAAYINEPQSAVFKRPLCASKVAHYKWRQVDPAYEDAYRHLVGDPDRPGVARLAREQALNDAERRAVGALDEARTGLRLASADAVATLVSAMGASTKKGDEDVPLWRERIVASNSILDRADQETAARSAVNVTTVEDAIAKVYGDQDQLTGKPVNQAALPAGDVLEGEVTPVTGPGDDEAHMSVDVGGQPAGLSAAGVDGDGDEGSTSLQASPHDALIWSDEHGWVEQGQGEGSLPDTPLTCSGEGEPADEGNNNNADEEAS